LVAAVDLSRRCGRLDRGERLVWPSPRGAVLALTFFTVLSLIGKSSAAGALAGSTPAAPTGSGSAARRSRVRSSGVEGRSS
jgi:hypothetical protein